MLKAKKPHNASAAESPFTSKVAVCVCVCACVKSWCPEFRMWFSLFECCCVWLRTCVLTFCLVGASVAQLRSRYNVFITCGNKVRDEGFPPTQQDAMTQPFSGT